MLVKIVLITTVFSMVDLLFDLFFQITSIAPFSGCFSSLLIDRNRKRPPRMTAMLQKCKQKEKEQSSLFFAQACQGMAQFWISTLREDKAFFFLRLCILILKVAKNV